MMNKYTRALSSCLHWLAAIKAFQVKALASFSLMGTFKKGNTMSPNELARRARLSFLDWFGLAGGSKRPLLERGLRTE
jgi:hypothetical protein